MKKLAVCLLSVITMVATLHVPAPAYGIECKCSGKLNL